ncbi:hypothetical protein DL762_006231 [Monosporascus cannonballus]|uniref:Acyl-CoA thioesterase-like C-terminal domain-containing protein n=1 Tax=Monosporascus cannonballus TaxID=155416 RepID=A0ABY0H326_9PEZI|nr:hypothetical protein DL762_006231 [Monosporascus cannonballus]
MASILEDQINLKHTTSHRHTVSYHNDWTIGSVLRVCEPRHGTVTIVDLKVGAGTSTLQLQPSQSGRLKVFALATATNFDKHACPELRRGLGAPARRTLAPAHLAGEILLINRHRLILNSRDGFPLDGICDAWNTFTDGERMDATCLTFVTDLILSISDTLLRNGGIFDARASIVKMEKWAEMNPGVPAELTNSFKEAMRATAFNQTATLDTEFKRRLPKEVIRWTFTRSASRMLESGRLDLDVTICDEKKELLCLARQVILVLDAKMDLETGRQSLPPSASEIACDAIRVKKAE